MLNCLTEKLRPTARVVRDIISLVCFIAFAAGSAHAQYVLPNFCNAYLTVQSKSYLVSHFYTCHEDTEGLKRRIDLDEQGEIYHVQTDVEARWLYALDMTSGISENLDDTGSIDRAFLTNLLQKDHDDFVFQMLSSSGEIIVLRGEDQLMGQTVIIDDTLLFQTKSMMKATDTKGTFLWDTLAIEYVSLKHWVFFGGSNVYRTDKVTNFFNFSPIEFLLPNEVGFLADVPKSGSEGIMSSLGMTGVYHDKI
tara:strand:+ start:51 stop:803 length:753 start_codon:yes stop_codon:yes gene_type:complete